MRCVGCQSENPEDAKFCRECGTPLAASCSSCGASVSSTDRFCTNCGSSLGAKSTEPPAEARSFTADLRQITVLFSDVVDSTVHARRLDPEDWRDLVRAYLDICAAQVEHFGGHVAQFLGDGVLVYFGFPRARETDAEGAVRAALGILEGVARLNAKAEEDGRPSLRIRCGLHTGPVVADPSGDRREPPAVGDTVHLANRFERIAEPDTIVISDTTRSLVIDHFQCEDLGLHEVKGFVEPARAWRVVRARSTERLSPGSLRTLPPMIGRDTELGTLVDRWHRARDGRGEVVTCVGDAGLGKSRIVAELRALVSRDRVRWVAGTCSPFRRNTALSPLIELLQQGIGWSSDEDPTLRPARMQEVFGSVSEHAPTLLGALLGEKPDKNHPSFALTAEERRAATHEAFAAWLKQQSQEAPIVALIEDIHWADPSTLAFLVEAIRWVPTVPILLLLTHRPELDLGWHGSEDVTPIVLPKLTSRQTSDLISNWTSGARLPKHQRDQIIEKTDGVPLFVEVMSRMVAEASSETDRAIDHIPATLKDLLEARLDRMGPAREVAQFAAVIGRRFQYDILAGVSKLPDERLKRDLQRLVDGDILDRHSASLEASYEFTHSLIHESAYQALLKSDRRAVHATVARELERSRPEIAHERPEHLAHHYSEAGEHATALEHWERAARRAMRGYANEEAVAHADAGLAAIREIRQGGEHDTRELRLLMTKAGALVASRGFGDEDVEPPLTRALEIARAGDDARATTGALGFLCGHAMQRCQYDRARDLSSELVARSEEQGDTRGTVTARFMLCATLLWRGEYEESLQASAEGIRLHDPADFAMLAPSATETGIQCRGLHALALWATGHSDRALVLSQAAVEMARTREYGVHAHTLGWTLTFLMQLQLHRRDAKDALATALETEELAREHRFQRLLSWGVSLGACARIQQGDVEEGVETLQRALSEYELAEAGYWRSYCNGIMAWGHGQMGRFDQAFSLMASAQDHSARVGERFYQGDLFRMEGDLILLSRPDAHEEAEAAYQRSLVIVRETGGVAWELRTLIHLARLRALQGRSQEGLTELLPVYERLVPRGDTVDLQEAAALLAAT